MSGRTPQSSKTSSQKKFQPLRKKTGKPIRRKRRSKGGKNSKKKFWWMIWLGAFLLAGGYISFFYYFLVGPYSFRWKAIYGDPIYPKGFDVHGIDVSHYQEIIDWELLRNASLDSSPVSFVFIKATEGESLMDENFNYNFYEAKQNSIIRGAYHFFLPHISAREQALFYLKQVHLEPGDLPPVLDVEKAGNLTVPQLQKAVKTWLDIVEQKYGVKPIIYTGYKFKMKYLNTPTFNEYPYWIAHYYVEELGYKGNWSFWQHTDCGKVNGIKGGVDCNIFNGSMEELMNLTIKQQDVFRKLEENTRSEEKKTL